MSQNNQVRKGSAPNFAPPVTEGETFTFQDQRGDLIDLEFLGLILMEGARYGFFFPVTEDTPAKSSGEVVCMEVTELDDEGQPSGFELVTDEAIAKQAYDAFQEATKDIYRFE